MFRRAILCTLVALLSTTLFSQSVSDLGNGKYMNPVIFADFPDPDVIRVGDTYYMVSKTMVNFPGATIVKS